MFKMKDLDMHRDPDSAKRKWRLFLVIIAILFVVSVSVLRGENLVYLVITSLMLYSCVLVWASASSLISSVKGLKQLACRPAEVKILRILAVASSLYLAVLFICNMYCHGVGRHLTEPERQVEQFAASSKAIEQVFCNVVLLLMSFEYLAFIIPFFLLGRVIITLYKKLRRQSRKAD